MRCKPLPPQVPVSLALLFAAGAVAAETSASQAQPVSPGGTAQATLIAEHCPTFSWGAAAGALRYEIAVFDALANDSGDYAGQSVLAAPLLTSEIAAPALSWTPAGEECLAEGGSYLWFVRAETAAGPGEWSSGRRFDVDLGADALAEAVRRELSQQLRRPELWREVIRQVLQSDVRRELLLTAAPIAGTPGPDRQTGSATAATPPGEQAVSGAASRASFPNPAALRISGSNGVVFDDPSAPGVGSIPAEGAGTRFMWYPGKAALRAGWVDGTQWDDVNVGDYSVAMGPNTTASDYGSTAMGVGTTASGAYSTAMGVGTTASGWYSTAMGEFNAASGKFSTAMGYKTTAESAYETVLGSYDTGYTPASATDWIDTDRLFVVGNGNDSSAPSNALVILKNGNTGIGDSIPTYKLEVAGDVNTTAGGYRDGGTCVAGTCASDRRLKEDIEPLQGALETLALLQPTRYRFRDPHYGPGIQYGLIAQEVEQVLPELVTESNDGYQQVRYGLELQMHMLQAIRELKNRLVTLERENAELLQVRLEQNASRAAMADEMARLQTEIQKLRDRVSDDAAPIRVALDH